MHRVVILLFSLCTFATTARADWPVGGHALGDEVLCRVGPTYATVPDQMGGVIAFATPWDVATRVVAAGDPLWSVAPYTQTNLPPATRIADDGAGGVWIGWAKDADVYVQHWNASGAPVGGTITVCHATQGVRFVTALAADGANGAYVLWNDTQTSSIEHVLASRVSASGSVVGPANGMPVFASTESDVLDGCGVDASGNLVVMEREATGVRLQAVTPTLGLAWASPTAIAGDVATFSIATSGGGTYVGWCQGSSGVRVLRLGTDGAAAAGWPAGGALVATSRLNARSARVCGDGDGGVFVAWIDQHLDGAFGVDDVRVSHVLGSAAVAPGWPAGGLEPGDSSNPSLNASAIVPDAAGGCYLAWADQNGAIPPNHVRAQHLNGDGTTHAGWPASGIPMNAERVYAMQVTAPALASDGAGGAYALWNEWRGCAAHESCNRAWLARLLDTGVAATPAPGPARLALAAPNPNPTHGRFTVQATLPDERPARLEVFDVAGRAVFARELSGAGTHAVTVDGAALTPGVHWVRLAHASGVRASRVVMVR